MSSEEYIPGEEKITGEEEQLQVEINMAALLDQMPFPIAAAYQRLMEEQASPQTRREALHFTAYQLVRTVGLTLIGQYLTQGLPRDASPRARQNLNQAIAKVRFLTFGDWLEVLNALHQYGEELQLNFFPEFGEAMAKMEARRVAIPPEYALQPEGRWQELTWLEALLALRQSVDQPGMNSEEACQEAIRLFCPFLDTLLIAFAFLREYELLALRSSLDEDTLRVQLLRGTRPLPPQKREVDDRYYVMFEFSPLLMRSPDDRVQALFPLFQGVSEPGYRGHFLRDDPLLSRWRLESLAATTEPPAEVEPESAKEPLPFAPDLGDRIRQILELRQIPWHLRREEVAPSTLVEGLQEYSRLTLEELTGIRYRPDYHLDRPALSRPLWEFVAGAPTPYRALLLTGRAGVGKTALLCDLERRLLLEGEKHLVLFVRGDALTSEVNGINPILWGPLQRIGLNPGDFTHPAQFFAHLEAKRQQEKLTDRRLVVILDGLNEAPAPERLLQQMLEMVSEARHYDWVRIVLSMREEFLEVWQARRGGTEANPFYLLHPLFVSPPGASQEQPESFPFWVVPPLTQEEAQTLYQRYQKEQAEGKPVYACRTPWEQIPPLIREDFLTIPLYLDLWMRAFDGREAPPLSGLGALFELYLSDLRSRFPRFWENAEILLDYLLAHGKMELTETEAREINHRWLAHLTEAERQRHFSPLEVMLISGVMKKQASKPTLEPGEATSRYFIPYQPLYEQLIYTWFKNKDSQFQPSSLHEWLALPPTEALRDALTRVAEELWEKDRTAELATFMEHPTGAHILENLLVRRLERHESPEAVTSRLETLLEGAARQPESARAVAELLITRLPSRLKGVAVTKTLQTLWETLTPWLENHPLSRSEDPLWLRNLAICYSQLSDLYGMQGATWRAMEYREQSLRMLENLASQASQYPQLRGDLAIAYHKLGDAYTELGNYDRALEYYQKDLALLESSASPPSSRDLAILYSKLGDLARMQGKQEQALEYYQKDLALAEPLAHVPTPSLEAQQDLAISYAKLGEWYRAAGDSQRAVGYYEKSQALLEPLVRREPHRTDLARDLALTYSKLADLYQARGDTSRARDFCQQAFAIRKRLSDAEPHRTDLARDLAVSYSKLGDLERSVGQTQQALEYSRLALAIRERLYEAESHREDLARDLANSAAKLGDFCRALGESRQALEYYQRAAMIRHELYQAHPDQVELARGVSILYNKLGDLHHALGESQRALEHYLKAMAIRQRLHDTHPDRTDLARDLSVSYSKLGDAYRVMGEIQRAQDYYIKDLAMAQKLHEAEPHRVDLARDLAVSYERMGDIYRAAGETNRALDFYTKALTLRESLRATEPNRTDLARDLAISYNKLSDCYRIMGDNQGALEHAQKALQLTEQLHYAEPHRVDLARDLVVCYNKIGDVYRTTGENQRVLEYTLKALEIAQRLYEAEPHRADLSRDLVIAYNKAGDVYRALGQTQKASQAYLKALENAERLHKAEPQRADYAWDLSLTCDRMALTVGGVETQEGRRWLERARQILRPLKNEGRLPHVRAEQYLQWLESVLK